VSAKPRTFVPITLNGAPARVPSGASIADLLRQMELPRERVAVEIQGAIVRKAEYEATRLSEGAVVEIVSFVGGG
jgi:thiamine biosynthesis protein ThiS